MINNNIALSDEQQVFIDKALEGKNILVDACIGSGKTTAIQTLCDMLPSTYKILYLTYNKLLKVDAKAKIRAKNTTVSNYHGFAFMSLKRIGVSAGISELIQAFNRLHPPVAQYDVLVLDEYQDIELEIAQMLEHIKASCPGIQIIAVGDMEQKIYDKTTLDASAFINKFLGEHERIEFTKCFRLSASLAETLGYIWEKPIIGVNPNCTVESMDLKDVVDFLAEQKPEDILCLGARTGDMAKVLNKLEEIRPEKFNKNTVFASIQSRDSAGGTQPHDTSAIFTTFDSSKGLERPICIVFDYTESYWFTRSNKPQQDYKILRNIFCVAASRGKQHIIFVEGEEKLLAMKTIATPVQRNAKFEDIDVSQLFSFKYKEDVEACYSLLDVRPTMLSDSIEEIDIKSNDGLIDLSPCIGNYQEAVFFKDYDVGKEIKFWIKLITGNDIKDDDTDYTKALDKSILRLTALETMQHRYFNQVKVPFVQEAEKRMLCDRLSEQFSPDDMVQVECSIPVMDAKGEKLLFTVEGRAGVVKNNMVYELKFVSELTHDHFLQCACYMIAMRLEVGILWNTRKNEAFEIRIPDRKAFLDEVVNTVTKGYLNKYTGPKKLTKIARPGEENGEETLIKF